jgi:WD40 repeat protein
MITCIPFGKQESPMNRLRVCYVTVFAVMAMAFTTVASAPLPPVITPENAGHLKELAQAGASSLRDAAFSPDGSQIAVGSGNDADFGVTFLKSDGLAVQSTAAMTGIVWDIAYSPDGLYLVSAANDTGGKRLRVWNPKDGSQVIALDGPYVASSVAFSPDGSRLAVGGLDDAMKGVIWIYDTQNWAVVMQLKTANQNITAMAYTPDGRRLVSGGTDGMIHVWSTADGKQVKAFSIGGQANRLAISADGRMLASSFCKQTNASGCSKGGVAVWDTASWTVITKFEDLAECLAFSPDSRLLVTGSGQNDAVMRFRRVGDWELTNTIAGDTRGVALSPDGRRLVSVEWETVHLWGIP